MNSKVFSFSLLFLFIFLHSHSKNDEHPKLVIELFRHGARGPLDTNGEVYWRGKEGRLTDVGKAQHFVQGAKLMKKYPHLEKVILRPGSMYLQSTQTSRTIESLKAHLWGMFYGKIAQVDEFDVFDYTFYQKFRESEEAKNHFNPHIFDTKVKYFEPTSITITPMKDEYELLITEVCQNIYRMLDPSAHKELDDFMRDISNQIRKELKLKLSSKDIRHLYDLQLANLFEGLPMLKGMAPHKPIWETMKLAGDYYVMQKRFGSPKQRTLLGVPIISKIANFLEWANNDSLNYDLVLLSAHEFTLMNFLTALNIITPECLKNKMQGAENRSICRAPAFASSIFIELWEKDGLKQVRMLYDEEPIPFCGKTDGFCDYDWVKERFDEVTSKYTLNEVRRECSERERDL